MQVLPYLRMRQQYNCCSNHPGSKSAFISVQVCVCQYIRTYESHACNVCKSSQILLHF